MKETPENTRTRFTSCQKS